MRNVLLGCSVEELAQEPKYRAENSQNYIYLSHVHIMLALVVRSPGLLLAIRPAPRPAVIVVSHGYLRQRGRDRRLERILLSVARPRLAKMASITSATPALTACQVAVIRPTINRTKHNTSGKWTVLANSQPLFFA
jgi:hypothetical protein